MHDELVETIIDLVMQMPDSASDDDVAIARRIACQILALPQFAEALQPQGPTLTLREGSVAAGKV